jgi:cytochrome c5
MRFLTVLAVSAAVLTPALALADPGQPQAAVSATAPAPAQAAPAAPATQTAQATPVAAPVSESNADEVVCRTGTPPTGTRLGATRECHTQREWDKRQQEAQDVLKKTQMMGHEGAMNSPGGTGK